MRTRWHELLLIREDERPARLNCIALIGSIGAGLVFVQQTAPRIYLGLGGAAAARLLRYSLLSNRIYASAILDTRRGRLFLPGRQLDSVLEGAGSRLREELVRGVPSDDEDVCVAYARLLAERFPAHAAPVIAARLGCVSRATRDRLLALLDARGTAQMADALWRTLDGADQHYRVSVLDKLMAARDARARAAIPQRPAAENPRLIACSIHGLLRFGTDPEQAVALDRLHRLLTSSDTRAAGGSCAAAPSRPDGPLPDPYDRTV